MTDWKKRIGEEVDPAELAALTEELIRIPSFPGVPGQETGVAECLRYVLEREGIPCRLDPVQDGRCNLIATLRGTGGGRDLLLCGHLDTVPPYDMENALIPLRSGDHIVGRGASDMKGPVAAMVCALLCLKRSGIRLKGDVIFAGVIDEECRSLGAVHLLEQGIRAHGAIVGEPSESKLCVAHRGLEWFEFLFTGRTVHGGRQAEGVNAISKAVKFITALDEELVPQLSLRRHPLMGRPTVNVGVIQGGTQLSTVAGSCSVLVDRRTLPSEDYGEVCKEFAQIIDRLSAADPDFQCRMQVTQDSRMRDGYIHPGLETDPDHPFARLVREQLSFVLGHPAEIACFPAWTDASLLSYYGKIPSVVYGPGYMACCHSKEEYVRIPQLEEGCLTYALCAAAFCGVASPD